MKYVVKLLNDVNGINFFEIAEEYTAQLGNTFTIYFQLFTSRENSCGSSLLTRYVPQGTSKYVEVTFDNINNDCVINRVAVNPFAGDTSIWAIQVLAQDQIPFGSMQVSVYEDGVKKNFSVETDFVTNPADPMLERFI
jgi:hypothetical protein